MARRVRVPRRAAALALAGRLARDRERPRRCRGRLTHNDLPSDSGREAPVREDHRHGQADRGPPRARRRRHPGTSNPVPPRGPVSVPRRRGPHRPPLRCERALGQGRSRREGKGRRPPPARRGPALLRAPGRERDAARLRLPHPPPARGPGRPRRRGTSSSRRDRRRHRPHQRGTEAGRGDSPRPGRLLRQRAHLGVL